MTETCPTLVDLLGARAARCGDRLAFAFLEDGGCDGERLTFRQLDQHAQRIAAWLQAFHCKGERALLLFPAGLDFLKAFFGCLYAGLVPIPAPAPQTSRRKRAVPRLRAIARDAQVALVLSTGETLGLVDAIGREVPELRTIQLLDIRNVPDGTGASWHAPAIDPGELAYLQYTSGSTTSPRGVMISHRNVLHHCQDILSSCEYTADSVSMTWLPYFHDYGLLEGMLLPLQNGTPAYVMSPFAFLKRPFAWLSAIGRFKVTHTQGPSFAYDQCVRRIKPEQLGQLDLSSLRSAENAAEPINPSVLENFYQTFSRCGLRREAVCPAYGLAEATLMVSCCPASVPPRIGTFDAQALGKGLAVETVEDSARARRVVSCGRPIGNVQVAIVDPETCRRLDDGVVGEIWVSDHSLALGYWQRERESRETFGGFIADTAQGPFLRTGDLGFLKQGELYVTSRIKDLIIVAGTNHYPQDIEWTIERCHPAIRANHVAASAICEAGEERLLVAGEVERGRLQSPEDIAAVLDAIRRAVSEEHEIDIYALVILNRGSLPKTASGKIQRHACERLLYQDGDAVLARWIKGEGLERGGLCRNVERTQEGAP